MYVKGYSDFSLSPLGWRTYDSAKGLHFKLDRDVSQLFPFINAVFKDVTYYEKPNYIRFLLGDHICSLYPSDVVAASFYSEEQARELVDTLIDFLNDLYEKKDSLTPNYKKFKRIPVTDIITLLPKTNCRECGFPTCIAFAAALSNGNTFPDKCPEFSSPIAENIVYPVYDEDGNLKTTVEIEVDFKKKKHIHEKQEEYIKYLEKKLDEVSKENEIPLEKDPPKLQTDLTDREIEVLCLVAEGLTNTEISEVLFISPHTVKSHVIHIFNKLSVNDRTQAAVWAARNRLV